MYKATEDQKYLDYAKAAYIQYGLASDNSVLSWDNKAGAVKVLLAQLTGDSGYLNDVIKTCDHLANEVKKSPKGETFIDQWGSLRHTSNAAFVCLQVIAV